MQKGNTSTLSPSSPLDKALANIPKEFRDKIIAFYLEIKKRYSEAQYDGEYDTPGMSSGKFVETVFRFLQHHLTGAHTPFGTHIQNFPDECRKLISLPQTAGVESLRIVLPRALVFLYTLRGKRSIGHVGGDLEANNIDLSAIVKLCDWIVCELIRLFHKMPIEEAQEIIEALVLRSVPDIWEVNGKKRILRKDLTVKQKVLLLSYSEIASALFVDDLFEWVEYKNKTQFKNKVLKELHAEKLIEYSEPEDMVFLSPTGIIEVESKIIKRTV